MIYRPLWLLCFALGAAALVLFVSAVDSWAAATALPGAVRHCRFTLAEELPVSRASLCLAAWFNEAKAWAGSAQDMVLNAGRLPVRADALRTADAGLFAIGALAGGVALAWIWATAMARTSLAILASACALLQALFEAFARRTA